MIAPDVKGWGDYGVEPFEQYLARWPQELAPFPVNLIETWVHRHWGEFSQYWMPIGALEWRYELRQFSNETIQTVRTFDDFMNTIDYWGDELFRKRFRQDSWLGRYMLSNGTTPEPILVYEGGAKKIHPRGRKGEKMLEPYQLVEGHMRTAYLRGLIRHSHPALKEQHAVWVATSET